MELAATPSHVQRSTPTGSAVFSRVRGQFSGDKWWAINVRQYLLKGYFQRPTVTIVFSDDAPLPGRCAYDATTQTITLHAARWAATTPVHRYNTVLHALAHHLRQDPSIACIPHFRGVRNPIRGIESRANLLGRQMGTIPGIGGMLARAGVLSATDGPWLELLYPDESAPPWVALEQAAAREDQCGWACSAEAVTA